MTWLDTAHYALGWACLLAILTISVWTISSTIAPARHRILAALRGEPIPPAASGAPTAPARHLQRRGVEAAAAPAFQVVR
jgi:hypothetical protein